MPVWRLWTRTVLTLTLCPISNGLNQMMTRLLIALLLLLSVPHVHAAAARFPGIESLMTAEELRAAGIETLSPQQFDALNAWIERYTSGATTPTDPAPQVSSAPVPAPVIEESPASFRAAEVAPAPAPTDNFGRAPEKIDLVSRIAGNFEGWSGNTQFILENGQVWQQRRGGRWKISLENPEVRIRENFMGAFEMEVLSEERSIGVRRIR